MNETVTYKCPKCDGKNPTFCDFCFGKQELNFIENLFGVSSAWEYIMSELVRVQPMPQSSAQIFYTRVIDATKEKKDDG